MHVHVGCSSLFQDVLLHSQACEWPATALAGCLAKPVLVSYVNTQGEATRSNVAAHHSVVIVIVLQQKPYQNISLSCNKCDSNKSAWTCLLCRCTWSNDELLLYQ